ncbi:hypothetical protein GCM10010399_36510 [Dactylosporangium fulvum]|uniref:DUF1963 domain-containing protein n=1 Tax=Dactylosporangium fulvum TaxID=53359 RepID=A0ABY5W8R5_9ACTN|nr:hypothetical protein [Dactylosporangium fulvum]UWP86418.1 hypothetical protein Dfulv_20115 [Dactylosporangium fulvum]
MSAALQAPVAKLGGQPFWWDAPAWPLSRSTGEPMTFVGQFPVPGSPARLAYLFMTDDDIAGGVFPETYRPDVGENALLIQPGGRVPSWLAVTEATTGPSLWRREPTWHDRTLVELAVEFLPFEQEAEAVLDAEIAGQDAERRGTLPDPSLVPREEILPNSYLGGRIRLWQPTVLPIDAGWRFFFQLDGGEGYDAADPYTLNFGGGTGYAFLSPDRREGRFFWDCA